MHALLSPLVVLLCAAAVHQALSAATQAQIPIAGRKVSALLALKDSNVVVAATSGSPGALVLAAIEPFALIQTLPLNTGEDNPSCLVADPGDAALGPPPPAGGDPPGGIPGGDSSGDPSVPGISILAGTATSPGRILKFIPGLTPSGSPALTAAGSLTLPTGLNSLSSAAVDSTLRFAYFATGGSNPLKLVRIDLQTFTFVDAATLTIPSPDITTLYSFVAPPTAMEREGVVVSPGAVVKFNSSSNVQTAITLMSSLASSLNSPFPIVLTLTGGVTDEMSSASYLAADAGPIAGKYLMRVASGAGSKPLYFRSTPTFSTGFLDTLSECVWFGGKAGAIGNVITAGGSWTGFSDQYSLTGIGTVDCLSSAVEDAAGYGFFGTTVASANGNGWLVRLTLNCNRPSPTPSPSAGAVTPSGTPSETPTSTNTASSTGTSTSTGTQTASASITASVSPSLAPSASGSSSTTATASASASLSPGSSAAVAASQYLVRVPFMLKVRSILRVPSGTSGANLMSTMRNAAASAASTAVSNLVAGQKALTLMRKTVVSASTLLSTTGQQLQLNKTAVVGISASFTLSVAPSPPTGGAVGTVVYADRLASPARLGWTDPVNNAFFKPASSASAGNATSSRRNLQQQQQQTMCDAPPPLSSVALSPQKTAASSSVSVSSTDSFTAETTLLVDVASFVSQCDAAGGSAQSLAAAFTSSLQASPELTSESSPSLSAIMTAAGSDVTGGTNTVALGTTVLTSLSFSPSQISSVTTSKAGVTPSFPPDNSGGGGAAADGGGLSGGAVAAIIIVMLALVSLAAAFFVIRRRRQSGNGGNKRAGSSITISSTFLGLVGGGSNKKELQRGSSVTTRTSRPSRRGSVLSGSGLASSGSAGGKSVELSSPSSAAPLSTSSSASGFSPTLANGLPTSKTNPLATAASNNHIAFFGGGDDDGYEDSETSIAGGKGGGGGNSKASRGSRFQVLENPLMARSNIVNPLNIAASAQPSVGRSSLATPGFSSSSSSSASAASASSRSAASFPAVKIARGSTPGGFGSASASASASASGSAAAIISDTAPLLASPSPTSPAVAPTSPSSSLPPPPPAPPAGAAAAAVAAGVARKSVVGSTASSEKRASVVAAAMPTLQTLPSVHNNLSSSSSSSAPSSSSSSAAAAPRASVSVSVPVAVGTSAASARKSMAAPAPPAAPTAPAATSRASIAATSSSSAASVKKEVKEDKDDEEEEADDDWGDDADGWGDEDDDDGDADGDKEEKASLAITISPPSAPQPPPVAAPAVSASSSAADASDVDKDKKQGFEPTKPERRRFVLGSS